MEMVKADSLWLGMRVALPPPRSLARPMTRRGSRQCWVLLAPARALGGLWPATLPSLPPWHGGTLP
eukprot:7415662-Alexandrium_andersonii.AAC.1